MSSPSKLFSCVQAEQICRSPINTSPAKQQYSFSKQQRFRMTKPYCDNFYNLPSMRMSRKTSLGFGRKTDLDHGKHPHNKTPSPAAYNIDSFVDINTSHERGSSVHIGRQMTAPRSYIELDRIKFPGPGRYQEYRFNETPKWSMRPITNPELFDKTTQIIVPGPNRYEFNQSLNSKGKYYSTKYRNSGSKVWNPPSSQRFYKSSTDVPGSGNYNPLNDLSSQGKYVLSTNKGEGCRRIGKEFRESFVNVPAKITKSMEQTIQHQDLVVTGSLPNSGSTTNWQCPIASQDERFYVDSLFQHCKKKSGKGILIWQLLHCIHQRASSTQSIDKCWRYEEGEGRGDVEDWCCQNQLHYIIGMQGRSFQDYTALSVIGRGTYAKVLLVRSKQDKQVYAMKVLKKKYIVEKNQEKNIMNEKSILSDLNHPFLVKLKECFQDEKKLYFVLQYCPGGELFGLLSLKDKLSEEQTKFYAAQIFLALDALHQRNIIYRDLKPQNVLLDKTGYIKVTDFGLSKTLNFEDQKAMSICGTPEYLAPQVIKKQGHNKAVDWWCLGCIIYEMVTGLPPFRSQNRMQLFEAILYQPLQVPNASQKLQNLLMRLLEKNPRDRLGAISSDEIRSHPWFQKVNWNALMSRSIKAPFVPILTSDADISNFDEEFTNCSVQSFNQNEQSEGVSENFAGFQYEPK